MNEGLTAETINSIKELVTDAQKKDNAVIDVEGKKYWNSDHRRIFDDYRPETISVSSLSAIAAYIMENREDFNKEELFIHVESPVRVVLYEKAKGERCIRTVILKAGLDNDAIPFNFDELMPTETFIIKLMSLFVGAENRDKIATIAGSLVSEKSTAGEDDGATMKYKSHNGVYSTSNIDIPKVIGLTPFRTFRQVEQPSSTFVFRYKADNDGKVFCGLFEADGGAWKHVAMKNIEEYLKHEIPGVQVIA